MPPAKQELRTNLLLYAVLAVLLAIVITYRIRDTTDRFDEVVRGHEIAQIPVDPRFPSFRIDEVGPEAAAAGLKVGDTIVGVQGRPATRLVDLIVPLMSSSPGETLALEVESATESGPIRRTAAISLAPMRTGPPRTYDWIRFAVGGVALPYLCLALGFWVVAVRIRDRLAWLLLVLLLGLSEFIGGNWRTLLGRGDWFQPVAIVYQTLMATAWPMTMMLFGLYFPERLPLDRRFPWAKWIVIGPILFLLGATNIMLGLLLFDNREAALAMDRVVRPTFPVIGVLYFVAISIFFITSGYRAFNERRPDARRRLMLLHAGAAVAITPLCVLAILVVAGVTTVQEWMQLPLYVALFVFPATMAYVIVVERAMDVRVVVRQGVQYLLARGTIRAIQLAASIGIFVAAVNMRSRDSGTLRPVMQILLLAAAVVALVLIGRFAERVRQWVDRRFFREAYNAEQILGELANTVRTIVDTRALLETVAHQIASSLHVPRVAILLNGGGVLQPAYAIGQTNVRALPLRDERAFSQEQEREIREALDAELLLPLSANQKVIGVMGLGPKQSEEPFSPADIRLLDAVAMQTGLALQNSRLTAEIATEVANREKANRELEIAREVQERLFPQEYPPIPGIEYAGLCRPALEVGGDYYDFLALGDSQLGIAIGDVSGKGVPAALLMATLRAYLRGQTIGGETNLAAMMANLNQLVYESSAANRYATFFYGQYDAPTGIFRYVNAGHNPPMVFKESGAVVRLDVGGPVVGLIAGCTYQQGSVTLDAHDILVAFTDGVSEAMNVDMNEWGEEQLMATTQRSRSLSPRGLIDRIIEQADTFVAGAPQHDDMTVIVVRHA
jgi:sigma-B regulation protein RsbU (phosphoserine phosphatase)